MAFALFLRNVDSILDKNEPEGEYNSFEYKKVNTKSLSLRLFASVVSESVNTLGDNTGILRHSTTVLLLRTRIGIPDGITSSLTDLVEWCTKDTTFF